MLTLRIKAVTETSGISMRFVVTINRQRSYMSSGIQVPPPFYNPKASIDKANWILPKHPLAFDLNQRLVTMYSALSTHLNELISTGKLTSAAEAIRLFKVPVVDTNLLAYLEHFATTQGPHKSAKWVEKYQGVIAKLSTYLNGKDLPIASITQGWLDTYRHWLEGAGHYKSGTAARHLSFIRTSILHAVASKAIQVQDNPFLGYRIKSGKVIKTKLTIAELAKVLTAKPTTEAAIIALDTWHLQYFLAGMRISDVLQIKNKDVTGTHLIYVADKTGKPLKLPIVGQAKTIIDKYRDTGEYLLPWLNRPTKLSDPTRRVESATSSINKQLVAIGKSLDLEVRLTTHQARHSFAEHARRTTGDIYAISKTLNHANLSVTESYLSSSDDATVEKLLTQIFAPNTDLTQTSVNIDA